VNTEHLVRTPRVPNLTWRGPQARNSLQETCTLFQTDNAVILLDGATQPIALERSGGWYADQLGSRIADNLVFRLTLDLTNILEQSLVDLIETHDLHPGHAPSSTVAIARWTDTSLDMLVLCDSPIIIKQLSGDITTLHDDRLDAVERSLPPSPHGGRDMSDARWRQRVAEVERNRNSPAGFWVASASPEAAQYAITKSIRLSKVDSIALLSDGVTAAVTQYELIESWSSLMDLASIDPEHLTREVHNAEEQDANCQRWARSKCHDDKSIAFIRFKHC
jgi:hypothetical protein